MKSQRNNGSDVATMQETIREYEKFIATRNASVTYADFGKDETYEDYWGPMQMIYRIKPPSLPQYLSHHAWGYGLGAFSVSSAPIEVYLDDISTPETESPFDELDELRNDEEKIMEISQPKI